MNGANVWMPALALMLGLAFDLSQNHLAAQERENEFDGARRERSLLPAPARPTNDDAEQTDGNQRFNGAARQFGERSPEYDEIAPQSNEELPPADGAGEPYNDAAPYLGVTLDPGVQDAAVAQTIAAGGPAEQAGIQPGDSIDAINDRPVSSYQDAYAIVESLRPGEIVDIDFSRRVSGRTQAVVGRRPAQPERTINYPAETTRRATRVRAQNTTVNEPLPTSGSMDDNSLPLPGYRDDPDREAQNNERVNSRRDERRPVDRPFIRLRNDRRDRRPLLPWRRN